MFAKKFLNNAKPFINQPARRFQQFTKTYQTGFDRMLGDKLSYFRLGGWWFGLFGIANAAAYGLSLFMAKDNYNYHFGYRGEKFSIFNFIKSQIGSNTFANVIWTAPTLIGLNMFLKGRFSNLVLTKFFFLTLMSNFIFLSAFNPSTGLNVRPLAKYLTKFDSFADDGSYTMGAD
jgi:hypothetical protein